MRRRAAALALALAAVSAAGAARAQDAGAPGAFACRTVFVDTAGLGGVDDLGATPAGTTLADLLAVRGLTRAPRADGADLTLALGFTSRVPATDDAGRLRAPQTVTLTATLRGGGDTAATNSVPHVVASFGHFGAVAPGGAWTAAGATFLRVRVAPLLDGFLGGHAAGARIQVDPPSALVAVESGAPAALPADGIVARCRRDGDTIAVSAALDGYTPLTQAVRTSTTDTPARLALATVAPPAPTATATSSSSSSSGGGGSTDTNTALLLGALIAAALGGSVVAAQVLRDKYGINVTPQPPQPKRLKVLYFAADPKGTVQLGLDDETRQIREKIDQGDHRDLIDFVPFWAARFDDILEQLNKHRPDVVHFSGHGAPNGAILLDGPDDAPAPMSPDVARQLFAPFAGGPSPLRLVVLNACFSAAQAEVIRGVVDCVIGSTREIADADAVNFAAAFYRAISFGNSIKNAFAQGLAGAAGNAAGPSAARDYGAPGGGAAPPPSKILLLARDGVDPDTIYLVGDAKAAPVG